MCIQVCVCVCVCVCARFKPPSKKKVRYLTLDKNVCVCLKGRRCVLDVSESKDSEQLSM